MNYSILFVLFLIFTVNTASGKITSGKRNSALDKQSDGVTNATVPSGVLSSTTTRRPILEGLQQLRLPCSCAEGQCGCCTGMILERFRQKACVNITYEPDDFAITARLTVNNRVLYKNTFSGKNPPPFCIHPPRFRFIELCVEFSNIYFAQRNVHMCIDAEASWQDFTLLEWSFDCIRLGANGVAVIGEEDGGGVPATIIDGEDQVDEDYDDSARNEPLKNGSKLQTIPINATITRKGDVIFRIDPKFNFKVGNVDA
ncbi:hypothetical protein Trydic_g5070 [Trypoxylus dichotomus]